MKCGGLTTNFLEIELVLQKFKPKIAFLSETHVTTSLGIGQFGIKNYNLVSCFSSSRHTGGIMAYISKNVKYKVILNEEYEQIWILCIYVKDGLPIGNYCGVYRSPSGSISNFTNLLENKWIDVVIKRRTANVLVGDFNINWLDGAKCSQLKNLTESYGLNQYVMEPTRFSRTSTSLIDLVFSNSQTHCFTDYKHKISDHETILVKFEKVNEIGNSTLVPYRCFKNYSKSCLQQKIRDVIPPIESELDLETSQVIETLKTVTNELIPTKLMKTEGQKKWFNLKLRVLKRRRDVAYKKAKNGGSWSEYRILKKQFSDSLKYESNKAVQNSIKQFRKNPGKLWTILNELVKPKIQRNKGILFDDVEYHDHQTVAEKFNVYFIESIKEINGSIETVEMPREISEIGIVPSRFDTFQPISTEQLKNIVFR